MNTRTAAILVVILFLLAAFFIWRSFRPSPANGALSVVFVGLSNSPARQMTPTRIEVRDGATGLCAMFLVRNTSSNRWLWFKTVSVESKTLTGWQPISSNIMPFSSIEGSVWTPGYSCLYAVGWPASLPTNATLRLQLAYGRDPSPLGRVVNQKIGRTIFRSGKEEAVIPSSEVSP